MVATQKRFITLTERFLKGEGGKCTTPFRIQHGENHVSPRQDSTDVALHENVDAGDSLLYRTGAYTTREVNIQIPVCATMRL